MSKRCDFCGAAGALRIELLAGAATIGAKQKESFRPLCLIVVVACSEGCVRDFCEGVHAGVVISRRALERVREQDLASANARVRQLEDELAIAKRGAVRYAARMVEQAASLCEIPPRAHRAAHVAVDGVRRLIENFAKRLEALPAPPSRYEREWAGARLEAVAEEMRANGAGE